MTDPGAVHLRLNLTPEGDRIAGVAVACRRPAAARLLGGKAADEAARLAPLLFAVCGQAQGLAARLALAAARGEPGHAGWDAGVAAEAVREHLWHFLGHDRALLAAGVRALGQGMPELVRFLQPLLGLTPQDWLALEEVSSLETWMASNAVFAGSLRLTSAEPEPAAVPLLQVRDAAASLVAWPRLAPAFAARPLWREGAAETGALARQMPASLLAALAGQPWRQRKAARLRELLRLALGEQGDDLPGRADAAVVAPRRGRALVETARGLLMHEVELEDADTVAEYVLVAPTEWNFHARGPLPAWLRDRPVAGADEARRLAAAAVAALDPCVPWSLDFGA